MKRGIDVWFLLVLIVAGFYPLTSFGQRAGKITRGSVTKHILISNGPQGPIQGGESAVTDMILMPDGWVYGSTKATWGAQNCHIFRTDGDKVEHMLNITSSFAGQTSITDLCAGKGNIIYGSTSTYDEILDEQVSIIKEDISSALIRHQEKYRFGNNSLGSWN